jgi:hypothetical protein
MAAAAVLVVMVLVGARVRNHRLGLRGAVDAVDQLTRSFATWEAQHRPRQRALDRHMTEIEDAVIHAEDSARRSSTRVRTTQIELLPRMEQIEHDTELGVLVTQGRIPSEHFS